ncbi:MAG: acetolactate decarboxylase [Alphaproteobacteria bacterium]|nr:acetolactate decarboxylase [Alphaproteobacteria bacterium]
MHRFKKQLWVFLIFLTTLYSCKKTSPDNEVTNAAIYQIGRFDSVSKGHYEGVESYTSISSLVDFGFGAYQNFQANLIVLDGVFFKTTSAGLQRAGLPYSSDSSSFSITCRFHSDLNINFNGKIGGLSQMQTLLKPYLKDTINTLYAIKIVGEFDSISTRIPKLQTQPFPILDSVLKYPFVFNLKNTTGTLLVYYIPQKYKQATPTGFHFHFIDNNRLSTGQVVNMSLNNAKVDIGAYKSLQILGSYAISKP